MTGKKARAFGKQRTENPYLKRKGIKDALLVEALAIQDGETLKLVFESVSSPWKQGVWLMTDAGIVIDGEHSKSVRLWFKESDPEVLLTCNTTDGVLTLYNVWDSGRGLGSESQSETSGMLVEEASRGFRYRCNDIAQNPDFSKLVFRIERLR